MRFVLSLLITTGLLHSATAPQQRSREILESALKEGGVDVRREAVIALSLTGQREPFITMLESALADKDLTVKLAAISSLSEAKTRRSVAALKKALQDETPEVSFAAAKALLSFNDPSGKAALQSVLSGETKTSSSFFTKQKRDAMRMMQTPKGVLMLALRAGASFVPVPGMGQGISSMQGILSDPSVSGRATAALLLARERDTNTFEALKDALSDKDASVRAAAVHAFALRGDPRVRKDLEPLLDDKKEAVRLRAAAAILRLQTLAARPSRPESPRSAPVTQN